MNRIQILEIGLQMEVGARDFYSNAAQRVTHPGTREMLRELAQEEARHVELFHSAIAGKDVAFGSGAPTPKQDLKLGEILDTPALSDKSEAGEILIIAIKAEMRAIRFYGESAKQFAGTETEQMLLSLVREEEAHKARLERIYDDEYLKDN